MLIVYTGKIYLSNVSKIKNDYKVRFITIEYTEILTSAGSTSLHYPESKNAATYLEGGNYFLTLTVFNTNFPIF